MRFGDWTLVTLLGCLLTIHLGCSGTDSSVGGGGSGGDAGTGGQAGSGGGDGGTGGDTGPVTYAGNVCVGAKQAAAAAYCRSVFEAWASWDVDQDSEARDSASEAAAATLTEAWQAAEAAAEDEDANCADLALSSSGASTAMETGIQSIAETINDALDLGQSEQAECGAALLRAARDACEAVLTAESAHVSDLLADADRATLSSAKEAALDAFSSAWANATSGDCPTTATEELIRDALEDLTDQLVFNTIVAPALDDTQYTTLIPGPTEYLGRTYTPQCMQGSEYRYYAKRGTVNKVLVYYQGGGACWNHFTCGGTELGAVCRTTPPDAPSVASSGFADLTNPNNPFRDWNIVFVSYCTCDIHFGDATQEYVGLENITVQHRGYHNSKVAEKWAREHFVDPEVVFVTGSSAGAYGAWFNGPLLHEVWPASQLHVLADAGNGVITTDFLENEFANWNFVANLPDIPGVLESLTDGSGMPGYTAAVASFFPDSNWAHYSTTFDGGQGGQTGFYNVMLNGGNPLAGVTWWDASCQFGENALSQSIEIFNEVPDNYRYYFGTGSRHTMWGADKVYDDTTGNVPTVVNWIEAMLASGPGGRDANWENILCDSCGLTLEGDPRPNPLEAPFEQQGEDVVIVCE